MTQYDVKVTLTLEAESEVDAENEAYDGLFSYFKKNQIEIKDVNEVRD